MFDEINYHAHLAAADYSGCEKELEEILMTYQKNRNQNPDPLYYSALTVAVKKLFIRITEALTDESFGDMDYLGFYTDFSLDIRKISQMAVPSYMEARMIEPKLAEWLKQQSAAGEKLILKYGPTDEETDEQEAVSSLLRISSIRIGAGLLPEAVCDQYARTILGLLDSTIAEITVWTEDTAKEFFSALSELQPGRIPDANWQIFALDLYEWFCLKNNLTVYQFAELYPEDANAGFRIAAYALRYPSPHNKFTQIFAAMQNHAENYPGTVQLSMYKNNDDAFISLEALEPAEKIAALAFRYAGRETEEAFHRGICEVLMDLMPTSRRFYSGTFMEKSERYALYTGICTSLGIDPLLKIQEEMMPFLSEPYWGRYHDCEEEYRPSAYDSKLQEWTGEQKRQTAAWTIRTTVDRYADCLNPGYTADAVCSSMHPEIRISSNAGRKELLETLIEDLAGAFEPKLAQHVAYEIMVRIAADEFAETPVSLFRLQHAAADALSFFAIGECWKPTVEEYIAALAALARSILPGEPLIANQLAYKIHTLFKGVNDVDFMEPVAHHYFLAGGIRHLLECARDACNLARPVSRVERLHGEDEDRVYANDLAAVDALYREVCRLNNRQPCVDIQRVI